MLSLPEAATRNLAAVREKKPLVHNITNFVVMNETANALLAMGASPVMAHAANEVAEMVALAGALVLNIGTLTDDWVDAMIIAGKAANDLKVPVILDPVGAGATSLRTRSAAKIIDQVAVSVIRGNASEILSLRRSEAKTRGVDAVHAVDDAAETARLLAGELQTTLAITGPVDLVTDGRQTLRVANGHRMMGWVTGTGCSATAAIGAFLAVDPLAVSAAATALAFYGLAGERAAETADAPGSFRTALIDALYTITPEDLGSGARFETGAGGNP